MSQTLKTSSGMKLPVATVNQATMPLPSSVLNKNVLIGNVPSVGGTIGQSSLVSSPSSSSTSSSSSSSAGVLSSPHALVGPSQQKLINASAVTANQLSGVVTSLVNQNGSFSLANGGISVGGSLSQQQMGEQQQNLANTKEKTPMCLINELARFNKVSHQYTLVDEVGPAHKKTFFVKLKLGEEEYSAAGPSIKKAQHAAAAVGLEKTGYKHPPPKPPKKLGGNINNITPTVELNALAMKRGEPAIYKPFERHPPFYPPPPHSYDYRSYYNQRYHYPRIPKVCIVSLKVGPKEFIGEGTTRQAARHSAAGKALQVLRCEPLPNQNKKDMDNSAKEDRMGFYNHGGYLREPYLVPNDIDQTNSGVDKDQLKSEISLVHEIALKRSLPVSFEVTRESGPPHMKTFVTRCTVGEIVTEAEGNSKKLSKKRAAEKMLEEMKKLHPLPPAVTKLKVKSTTNKKKNRNLIKMQKADPNYGVGINPISRLIQIMQAKKKKEPVYTLITERGLPWRREFVMQVTVEDQTCTGVGPNKKLAKRNAADGILQVLGYSRPAPQPVKSAIKTGSTPEGSSTDKKVTFMDVDGTSALVGSVNGAVNGRSTCQLMPGLLRIPEASLNSTGAATQHQPGLLAGLSGRPITASIVRPEKHLRELAHNQQIEIQFQDYAGKNDVSECLSRVSLTTDPPQDFHGTGPTLEASRDAASLQTLKFLAEKGLVKSRFTDTLHKDHEMDQKFGSGDCAPLKIESHMEKLANSTCIVSADHQKGITVKSE